LSHDRKGQGVVLAIGAMDLWVTASIARETHIEIVTPVMRVRKWEIAERDLELDAPSDRMRSCYQFKDVAYGACDSRRLRLRAFAAAGISDPIAYRVPVER